MLASEIGKTIIEKRKFLIAFLALAIIACNVFLGFSQSYTAEVYIKFTGADVKNGLAIDGSQLNPFEISNAMVVKNTLASLGMEDANQEQIRKNIIVTPVYTTEDDEKHAAWVENFSDYEKDAVRPTAVYYSVKFQTNKGADFANRFLDALVEQYRKYYTENHAYSNDVIKLSDKAVMQYDYFETADMLETKIKANEKYLNNILSGDFDYRSPETGYAISDLIQGYRNLMERELASVSQDILDRGLSKNNEVIQTALTEKADKAGQGSERNATMASSHKEVMDIYSEKNNEYTWETYSDASKGGSEQVREDTERDEEYKREETTYDKLILEYVGFGANREELRIDKEYYSEYASFFKNPTAPDAKVETALNEICTKYNELHDITEKTLADYNEYKSAKYVAEVSGVAASETISEVIYYAVAVVFAFVLGVIYIIFVELKRKKKI